MIYLQLFWSFVQIGLLSIGGGYASVPQIQRQVVEAHAWLTMEQFADITAIAEMTPGPIAINAATFVGTRIAGLSGALVATFGCVLPSFVIVMALAKLYYRYRNLPVLQGALGGMRPAVIAMIASAGLSLLVLALYGNQVIPTEFWQVNIVSALIFVGALLLLRLCKAGPVFVLALAGVVGVIAYSVLP